jgi:hypothetical protein
MADKTAIAEALEREVGKLIRRHSKSTAASAHNQKKYQKRSGQPGAPPASLVPPHWALNPHFNPYHVRARIQSFSHAIAKKIRTSSYEPNPSLLLPIPKPGGGSREISISTVPDAAVAYWLGSRLIKRNSYRFSSYTYAYRADRNAHHAIEHLMANIRGHTRLFVLEYDFAKYFDSIRHDYLYRILDDHFLVSPRELHLLKTFLTNRHAKSLRDYQAGTFVPRTVGIPQGSNISLFLANVACFELDREIEQVGVTFARYADDTLIVCDDYHKADACAKILLSHGDRSGTQINFAKSPGISLLTPDTNAELRHKNAVDFLAHSLSPAGVGISAIAICRIKRRVATIIYNNLLLQPKRGKVNPERLGTGFSDWDLVTCVNELRRYIYGRISDKALSLALSGIGPVNVTLCAMSFYPTGDSRAQPQLKSLDGWLVDVLARAYEKRRKILKDLGLAAAPISRKKLITGAWYSFQEVPVETKLPSSYRAWRYVRKAADVFGLEKFPSPTYEYQ